MKRVFLFIIVLVGATDTSAQTVYPGAVKSPLYWYSTDANIQHPAFKNNMPGTGDLLYLTSGKIGSLNFRPALHFDGTSHIDLGPDTLDLARASFFTVYQCSDIAKENIVWYSAHALKPHLVLTTSRMADLRQYRYLNFVDKVPLQPKVNTYVQQKDRDSLSASPLSLVFGNKPTEPQLPVVPFKGLMPEFVVYNRVLDGLELSRVASYLCLKYGITLSEPEGIYRNSADQPIWDGQSYSGFHHNIAGLIRDDSSGLAQKTAESSNTPGLLVLSTADSMADKASFLWGDNDAALGFGEKISGMPLLLARKWLAVGYGLHDTLKTRLSFDLKQLDAPLPVRPVLWLAVDRSGTGDFAAGETEFVRMDRIGADKIVEFPDLTWKGGQSSKTAFSFAVGGNILLSSKINEPHCSMPNDGSIELRIWGGVFPCRITVHTKNGQLVSEQLVASGRSIVLHGIAAGAYTVKVTDAAQNTYADTYYINNSDGPRPNNLQATYWLPEGQRLMLDAGADLPSGIDYLWAGPGSFRSLSPRVTLSDAGTYTLTASRNGCIFVQDILVARPPKNIFTGIKVYPNPSSSGSFEIKVSLDKKAPVSMGIFAEDGRFIGSRQLDGFANYTFAEHIGAQGLYHLVFRSGLSVATEKIIILK